MTRFFGGLLTAILLSSGVGCSQEQTVSVANLVTQAKAEGRRSVAMGLAASAFASQQTILYLATAMAGAASADLQGDDLPPIGEFGQPGTQLTYTLDADTGTGQVNGVRQGQQVVALAFTYEKEVGNAGMAYTITSTSGHVEGFEMFFPRLTLVFTAVLGDNFEPLKNALGEALFNVRVDAGGSFGIAGTETMRLASTRLDFTYPFKEGEAKLGAIIATTADGARFEGELRTVDKAIKVQGAIKDGAGKETHILTTTVGGEPTLRPASPPIVPSPAH